MLSRVMPVLGIVLSATALIVAIAAASVERPEPEDMGPRFEDARQRVAGLQEHVVKEGDFITGENANVQRAEQAAASLEESVKVPDEKAARKAAAEVLDANWPEFIRAYYYAGGRIGVLDDGDRRRADIFKRMWSAALKQQPLTDDQRNKAAGIIGETQALFSKAKPLLAKWPKAVEIERNRLIDDACRKLKDSIQERRLDAVRDLMDKRLR